MIDLLTKFRRELHQIPELGLEEFKTSTYLKTQLGALGFKPFSLMETDVLVYIDRGSDKTIAFRSDIDALPIEEENDMTFKSLHDGKMHACGHDGHMSMLLTFATYLKAHEDELKQNILLIFQPSEETIGGADLLIQKGLFDKYPVDRIYGIHVFPELPEGMIGSKPNAFMAMSSEVNVKIKGRGAHGAMPHLGVDANVIASKFLLESQTIQTRQISPMKHTIITFGKMGGGSVRNMISDKAYLEGTIRAFDKETFQFIKDQLQKIARALESIYDCEITVTATKGYLPVVNDPVVYETFREATKHFNYYEFKEPLMIAEDYSFYQDKVPGVFFFVGVKNEAKDYVYPLHHPKFNLDEKALATGVKAYQAILKQEGAI